MNSACEPRDLFDVNFFKVGLFEDFLGLMVIQIVVLWSHESFLSEPFSLFLNCVLNISADIVKRVEGLLLQLGVGHDLFDSFLDGIFWRSCVEMLSEVLEEHASMVGHAIFLFGPFDEVHLFF